MCNPALGALAASSIASGAGGYTSAQAQKSTLLQDAENADRQGITAGNTALVADNNAKLAEFQAQDALNRGATAEGQSKIAATALKSQQRAALAANGVDVNTGTANDIQTGTDLMNQVDVATIKDNALRDAWGYRVQATSYRDTAATARADAALYATDAERIRAQAGVISPRKSAFLSMLGGAGQVATQWYASRK